METTITINSNGLVSMLKDFNKKSFASIKAITIPKLNKKSRKTGMLLSDLNINPDSIRKCSEMVIGLGYDYETLIINRSTKEGHDVAYEAGTSWHEPFEDSTTIHQHKKTGEKYLFVECIANNKPKSKFVDIETGKEIAKEVLVDYLPVESEPTNQGLDNPIAVRTFKLESIRELKVSGTVYQVV